MNENVMVRMKQNLSILGLRNTYENIDEYLGNAMDNKVSITEFLDLIFEREAKAKVNRSVENQIKMAGFPARKTFELYDFGFQPNLDTDMIDDLRTLRFIGNN
jgi:DNA replication protein DnaC